MRRAASWNPGGALPRGREWWFNADTGQWIQLAAARSHSQFLLDNYELFGLTANVDPNEEIYYTDSGWCRVIDDLDIIQVDLYLTLTTRRLHMLQDALLALAGCRPTTLRLEYDGWIKQYENGLRSIRHKYGEFALEEFIAVNRPTQLGRWNQAAVEE